MNKEIREVEKREVEKREVEKWDVEKREVEKREVLIGNTAPVLEDVELGRESRLDSRLDSKNSTKYIFKLIFAGDANTGKTTLCNTIMNKSNKTMQYQPTIGIDFNPHHEEIYPNANIRLHLWDTAGQEKYRSITNSYYRNTCGLILTYDTTCERSFRNLLHWFNEYNRFTNCTHEYPHTVLLLGTKADLVKKRRISYEDGFMFAQCNNMIFREVNSFERKGPLESGFLEFLRSIYLIVENERTEFIRSVPIAKPVDMELYKNSTEYQEEINTTFCKQIISCKGVGLVDSGQMLSLNISQHARNHQGDTLCNRCV